MRRVRCGSARFARTDRSPALLGAAKSLRPLPARAFAQRDSHLERGVASTQLPLTTTQIDSLREP
jgi:hypothetical protein